MAVYTKIGLDEINLIEKNFSIGKILNYSGIKKGIENTNYLIKSKKRKFILTIFEKRVNSRDLPFFMNLMSRLSKLKVTRFSFAGHALTNSTCEASIRNPW